MRRVGAGEEVLKRKKEQGGGLRKTLHSASKLARDAKAHSYSPQHTSSVPDSASFCKLLFVTLAHEGYYCEQRWTGLDPEGWILHSRSKSSSLSRYFMMFRLILDESTHVTKSSMFLHPKSAALIHRRGRFDLPRHQKGRIRDYLRPDPHVTLLNELMRRRHRLRHPQPRHHHTQPPPTKRAHGDLPLHVA